MKFQLLQGRNGLRKLIALLKAFTVPLPVPDILFIPFLFSKDIAGWCFVPGEDAVHREQPTRRRRCSFNDPHMLHNQ
ncbi:hypothetical protein HGH92_31325 [Chitinophaga varians]|uniref:Uncharacterized protein n=1 Tax=Chitinophaga varians TaxID=2202339 RepID=A0A847S328_9BACT|nr:hypothetical protein [Chitinophaga varians]NLR68834.1 hypothetical protein [Chitinophaga varians]